MWLGYRPDKLIEQKLWIFYIIIAIEYVFQIRQILFSRFHVDKSMYVAGFIIILAIHGLLIGVGWQNKPAKIATDTIPLFVAGVNIILACQVEAYKDFNFARVEGVNIAFSIVMIVVGIISVHIGHSKIVSLGGALSTAVSVAIIATSIWRRNRFSIIFVVTNLAIFIIIAQSFNRTIGATLVFIFTMLFFSTIVVYPFRLYILLLLIGGAVVLTPIVVPPGSPLARRIEGLNYSNIEQQNQEGTGSIGERIAEWSAIKKKISQKGRFAEVFGLGHGAVYDVVFPQGPASQNYSNAHFGWALFYLRYGYCGFIYLLMFAFLMAANIYRNVRSKNNFNRVVLILCVAGIIYIFTYMAFNIILSGIQFMHMRSGPGKLVAHGSADSGANGVTEAYSSQIADGERVLVQTTEPGHICR
jgi:hypothetical protein